MGKILTYIVNGKKHNTKPYVLHYENCIYVGKIISRYKVEIKECIDLKEALEKYKNIYNHSVELCTKYYK